MSNLIDLKKNKNDLNAKEQLEKSQNLVSENINAYGLTFDVFAEILVKSLSALKEDTYIERYNIKL